MDIKGAKTDKALKRSQGNQGIKLCQSKSTLQMIPRWSTLDAYSMNKKAANILQLKKRHSCCFCFWWRIPLHSEKTSNDGWTENQCRRKRQTQQLFHSGNWTQSMLGSPRWLLLPRLPAKDDVNPTPWRTRHLFHPCTLHLYPLPPARLVSSSSAWTPLAPRGLRSLTCVMSHAIFYSSVRHVGLCLRPFT